MSKSEHQGLPGYPSPPLKNVCQKCRLTREFVNQESHRFAQENNKEPRDIPWHRFPHEDWAELCGLCLERYKHLQRERNFTWREFMTCDLSKENVG